MNNLPDNDILERKAALLGSLLLFTQTFYNLLTGREFRISFPDGRESHFYVICRALVKVLEGKIKRLIINVPPRYGKTALLIHFVSWAMAHFPDSNFLYVSYSHSLAKKQTQNIRDIINSPFYRKIVGITISDNSSAKDDFELDQGGSVYAAGAGGTITGRGAGVMGCNRFGGAVVIDDIHKPDEVTSDTMRNGIIEWYYNTMQSRLNNGNDTPIIFIGQRLHEDDLPANLIKKGGWEVLSIPALDEHNNALYPELHSTEDLLKMKEQEPYVFAAQYQQNPQPAGGGIIKPEWFVLKDEEPKMLVTFITSDTAETTKTYNNATVFSFFGIYKINIAGSDIEQYGLHWIDCVELRVDPKDLLSEFMSFYAGCLRYPVKPKITAIEKKSTGVTLVSILENTQGLEALPIERSINKTERFLAMQPYIASKLISLPRYGKHTQMCLEHMRKITANKSHRFDDVADTLADSIDLTFISKMIPNRFISSANTEADAIVKRLANNFNKVQKMQEKRRW